MKKAKSKRTQSNGVKKRTKLADLVLFDPNQHQDNTNNQEKSMKN